MTSESHPEAATSTAETELFQVFQSLPLAAPSESFAARVLERAGIVPAPVTRLTWSWRAALAVSLVLAGLAAAVLPSVLVRLVGPMALIRPLEWAAAAFVGIVHQLAAGLDFWSSLADAGHGIRLAFSTTPLFAAVLAGLLLSAIAFRVLNGLLHPDRRRSHYVY
jgi:hypothetical protein